MYDEILAESLKKIPGVLKNNEIPNARYIVYNGILMIEMYDTMVYFVSLSNPISAVSTPIGFSITINENKELVYRLLDRKNISQLMNYFNYYNNIPNTNPLIANSPDIQSDPEFTKLLQLKSGEGMKFYKLHNTELYGITYIPIFNGFPALAKSDGISAKVYKDNIEGYSVIEYTIFRTKLKDYIKMYFRIVNL